MVTGFDLARWTVKIAGGSGCLFQPSDESYSYILTAKHVVKDIALGDIMNVYIEAGHEKAIKITPFEAPFCHPDPDKDAAIIKIEKFDNIAVLLRAVELRPNLETYLAGHPAVRNAKGYTFRKDPLTIMNEVHHGYLEGQFLNNVDLEEIRGQSGGGIFQYERGTLLLGGIQHAMAQEDDVESLSRHEFMPLSFFDEIIELNTQLSPLFPPYIQCFDHLVEEIFELKGFLHPQKRELIQNQLKSIAKGLGNGFSPKQILESQSKDLLVNGTDQSMLHHKQLWSAFLEMLSYCQLHSDEKLGMAELPTIFKKRKLYFADTKAWTEKLENIYRSDLSAVEKGGTILVAATEDYCPTLTEIPGKIIGDISNVPMDEMNISNTIEDPFTDLRVVHIFALQKHIIENVLAYAEITATNAKKTLRDGTKGII